MSFEEAEIIYNLYKDRNPITVDANTLRLFNLACSVIKDKDIMEEQNDTARRV